MQAQASGSQVLLSIDSLTAKNCLFHFYFYFVLLNEE